METDKYIQYEYLSLNIKSQLENMYIDTYESFGWQLISKSALTDEFDYYINHTSTTDNKNINIKFKRNRKIENKEKLNTLQRKCEEHLKTINRLEREPFEKATSEALIIAILGCILLGICVLAITSLNNALGYIIGIPFATVGVLGWGYAYFRFVNTSKKIEEKNKLLIDNEYEKFYEVCDEAHKLTKE